MKLAFDIKQIDDYLAKNSSKIFIGAFVNQLGELFVVTKRNNRNVYYVTGTEMEWKTYNLKTNSPSAYMKIKSETKWFRPFNWEEIKAIFNISWEKFNSGNESKRLVKYAPVFKGEVNQIDYTEQSPHIKSFENYARKLAGENELE